MWLRVLELDEASSAISQLLTELQICFLVEILKTCKIWYLSFFFFFASAKLLLSHLSPNGSPNFRSRLHIHFFRGGIDSFDCILCYKQQTDCRNGWTYCTENPSVLRALLPWKAFSENVKVSTIENCTVVVVRALLLSSNLYWWPKKSSMLCSSMKEKIINGD